MFELEALIFIVVLWTGLCWIISSFFKDRVISRNTIFWLSLFFSPIIGILIGISSERKQVFKYSDSNSDDRKDLLLSQIVRLKKEEELGIISDNGKVKLQILITEYQNFDQIEEESKRKRELEREYQRERIQKSKEVKRELERRFISDMIKFTYFVIIPLMLILLYVLFVKN